jgi:hypothetical protein
MGIKVFRMGKTVIEMGITDATEEGSAAYK